MLYWHTLTISSTEEHPTDEARQAFKNLIALFNELIVHDVFSHDAYMHMLISRGDLGLAPAYTTPLSDSDDLFSVKSQPESLKHDMTLGDVSFCFCKVFL